MNKVKAFLSKIRNKLAVASVASVSALAMATGVSAASETGSGSLDGAGDLIIQQFEKAAGDIKPIIIGILGTALGLFIVFVGIKLGKKMFTTVSK